MAKHHSDQQQPATQAQQKASEAASRSVVQAATQRSKSDQTNEIFSEKLLSCKAQKPEQDIEKIIEVVVACITAATKDNYDKETFNKNIKSLMPAVDKLSIYREAILYKEVAKHIFNKGYEKESEIHYITILHLYMLSINKCPGLELAVVYMLGTYKELLKRYKTDETVHAYLKALQGIDGSVIMSSRVQDYVSPKTDNRVAEYSEYIIDPSQYKENKLLAESITEIENTTIELFKSFGVDTSCLSKFFLTNAAAQNQPLSQANTPALTSSAGHTVNRHHAQDNVQNVDQNTGAAQNTAVPAPQNPAALRAGLVVAAQNQLPQAPALLAPVDADQISVPHNVAPALPAVRRIAQEAAARIAQEEADLHNMSFDPRLVGHVTKGQVANQAGHTVNRPHAQYNVQNVDQNTGAAQNIAAQVVVAQNPVSQPQAPAALPAASVHAAQNPVSQPQAPAALPASQNTQSSSDTYDKYGHGQEWVSFFGNVWNAWGFYNGDNHQKVTVASNILFRFATHTACKLMPVPYSTICSSLVIGISLMPETDVMYCSIVKKLKDLNYVDNTVSSEYCQDVREFDVTTDLLKTAGFIAGSYYIGAKVLDNVPTPKIVSGIIGVSNVLVSPAAATTYLVSKKVLAEVPYVNQNAEMDFNNVTNSYFDNASIIAYDFASAAKDAGLWVVSSTYDIASVYVSAMKNMVYSTYESIVHAPYILALAHKAYISLVANKISETHDDVSWLASKSASAVKDAGSFAYDAVSSVASAGNYAVRLGKVIIPRLANKISEMPYAAYNVTASYASVVQDAGLLAYNVTSEFLLKAYNETCEDGSSMLEEARHDISWFGSKVLSSEKPSFVDPLKNITVDSDKCYNENTSNSYFNFELRDYYNYLNSKVESVAKVAFSFLYNLTYESGVAHVSYGSTPSEGQQFDESLNLPINPKWEALLKHVICTDSFGKGTIRDLKSQITTVLGDDNSFCGSEDAKNSYDEFLEGSNSTMTITCDNGTQQDVSLNFLAFVGHFIPTCEHNL